MTRQNRAVWQTLIEEARRMHLAHEKLTAFCPFPDDLQQQDVAVHRIGAADLLEADGGLFASGSTGLRDAFAAASPFAKWRETYKHTDIGDDFLNRFGCYCLIGAGGAFHSAQMWAYVVYMPAGLHYPWHHHPGEEAYVVLGGEAEFFRHGDAPKVLTEGGISVHGPNQPHAMTTGEHPVMAYVVWRNGFDVGPQLTENLTTS